MHVHVTFAFSATETKKNRINMVKYINSFQVRNVLHLVTKHCIEEDTT